MTGGPTSFSRKMFDASCRDTDSGFSLGGHAPNPAAPGGTEDTRLERLKRSAPKIRRRQAHTGSSFSQDIMAPAIIMLILVAGIVSAVAALPVNGLMVVIFIFAGAGAFIAGNKVANSMSRKRKNSPGREEV